VLPPKEERVDFAGDGSVGAARRELLDELIAAARPSSIVDVGCGEATLLCRVLDRALADAPGATPPQLVGVEALGPPLRKAQAAIERRLHAHAGGANARVALYRGALEGLVGGEALELPYGIDLVTCVEVVEHLDPAPLAAFGDAILGRCAPRVAIVTTPNKEYNVCFRSEGLSKGQFNPLMKPPPLAASSCATQTTASSGRAPSSRRGPTGWPRATATASASAARAAATGTRTRRTTRASRARSCVYAASAPRRRSPSSRRRQRRPRPTPRRWRRGSGRRRSGCGPP